MMALSLSPLSIAVKTTNTVVSASTVSPKLFGYLNPDWKLLVNLSRYIVFWITANGMYVLFWCFFIYATFVQKKETDKWDKTRLQTWAWLTSVPSVAWVTYVYIITCLVLYHALYHAPMYLYQPESEGRGWYRYEGHDTGRDTEQDM